jgi:uncharacterized protein
VKSGKPVSNKNIMKNLSMLLIFCSATTLFAQLPAKLVGIWVGKINVGVQLRVVFNFITDSSGNITATTDSPDQGIKGIACSDILLVNDSLSLAINPMGASFKGKFKNDSVITGQLIQGRKIDLNLKKVLAISALIRPQTPIPPFSYSTEDVEYDNTDHTLHFGATMTIPKGKGPFTAVLLITGSGAQNRDEEIMGHKPFAVIADDLTKQGIIVLRVDDRGMGKSSGAFSSATSADFATDASTSLNYLKSRKEVDIKHLGMIGHSEGGMIAPMVATNRNDINFIILLAAPGEKISKLMEEQHVAILLSSGFKKDAAEGYGNLYHNMIGALLASHNTHDSKRNLNDAVELWKKRTPQNIVLATTGIRDDSTQKNFVDLFAATLNSAWFKYFLQFDPYPYLSKLHCKVLALNGDKDLQVLSAPNLAGIKAALQKSESPAYEVKEMPGLNHLFQHCKKCTVAEYGELEETFATEVLKIMSDWILQQSK